VAGPRAAAAASIINTPAPVAVGLTPMIMSDICTNPEEILAVRRASKAISLVFAMMITMNRDPHLEEPTY
jgi:hypothetical protein